MSYLIEFRFQGKKKHEIKKLIYNIRKKFGIRIKRAVPHITLVGPFTTRNQKKLISDFNRLCSISPIMSFEIKGFNTFENNNNVVYLDVSPSKDLSEFRWKLSQTLSPYCNLKKPFDYNRNFNFHATIAMNLDSHKFVKVKNYISKMQPIRFNYVPIRATLIKRGIILREYDFFLRRPLTRKLAKSKKICSKSFDLLKAYFNGEYEPQDLRVPRKGILDRVRDILKPRAFIISDLHLDHKNIIKYCNRPFNNVKDMNNILVHNWNSTISKRDTVYFLGDLDFGKKSKSDYWLKKLNGNIIFIKGNHDDKFKRIEFYNSYKIEYKGYKFLMIHDPSNKPKNWSEWLIHGHHHNNHPNKFPRINRENKTINVSVELWKYKPINFDEIIELIKFK